MKSKVISTINFNDIVDYIGKVDCKLTSIEVLKEKEKNRILAPFTKKVAAIEGDVVSKNDIALLKLVSNIKRYNKSKIPVTVGNNKFNKEIEDLLIGMKINENKEITIKDEKVTFTVLSFTKKIMPELTLDIVSKHDVNVESVESYLTDTASKKQFETKMKFIGENVLLKVFGYMFSNTEFDLDVEEENVYIENNLKKYRLIEDELEGEGDSLTERCTKFIQMCAILQFRDNYDVEGLNDEQIYDKAKDCIADMFKAVVMSKDYCDKTDFVINEEDYISYVKGFADHNKMDIEKAKEIIKYSDFEEIQYQTYLREELMGFLDNNCINYI